MKEYLDLKRILFDFVKRIETLQEDTKLLKEQHRNLVSLCDGALDVQRRLKELPQFEKYEKLIASNDKTINELVRQCNFLSQDILTNMIILGQFEKFVITARRIRSCFRYKTYIYEYNIELLSQLFNELKISTKEQIVYFEIINQFNSNLNKKNPKYDQEMLNLLKYGYEVKEEVLPDKPDVEMLKERIFIYIMSEKNLTYKSLNEIFSIIAPTLYSKRDFECVSNYVSRRLQIEIFKLIELFNDKSNYLDVNVRKMIIDEIHKLQYVYNFINTYFATRVTAYAKKEVNEEKEKIQEPKIQLTFSTNSNGEAYILEDINKTIPKEYIQEVINLLTKFKLGLLSPKEIRKNARIKNCIILGDYQIKIIVSHIENNIYNVHGVTVNKGKSIDTYMSISNRQPNLICDNLGSEESLIIGQIEELINNKKKNRI